MKTIYNLQGESKTCDAVDAREHIATGRWFAEAPAIVLPEHGEGMAAIANAPLADASVDGASAKRGRK